MSATRLSDLAHSLGLNIATVSRALRDDPRVKPETRERIHTEAQRLGYRPHVAARALAEGRTRTLWFVIADLADAIAREPAVFASHFLLEQGYDLLLAQHHNDEAVFRRILERLSRGGADGAIIIPDASSQGTADSPLWEAKVPFVYLDRTLEGGQGAPVVTTDNRRAGASLVQALAKLEGGAPDVVVNGFGHPYKNSAELARRAGVEQAARELGLPTVSAGQSWAKYRRAVVLASTEDAALGLAQPITRVAGLGVFDHWRSGPRPGTKILVAVQDFQAMARAAVECILAQLRGDGEVFGEVLVPLAETLEVK